jgi:hypothetical protein
MMSNLGSISSPEIWVMLWVDFHFSDLLDFITSGTLRACLS